MTESIIEKKINIILKIILVVFCSIAVKIWLLGIIKNEKNNAIEPQKRTIIQKANRGIICDRNDIPLAVNKIKYNATIYYSHLKEIPNMKFEKNQNGKKTKKYIRKEYIKKLSEFLAKELNLNANRIEDLIHSKASILSYIPYVIKENISEKQYYKLRMLQKDWPGLFVEICQERNYPLQKVASDLLGYLGKISQTEYLKIANESNLLEVLLEKYENQEMFFYHNKYPNIESVKNRYLELKNLAYKANDLIGKASIEKIYDEKLKGFDEKRHFAVDIKGNFLKEIGNFKKPQNGLKLNLSIDSNLQAFAENLLIEDEKQREGQSKIYVPQKKDYQIQKTPWIKGGTIIAMDPLTGEILALASYPRFDPNDFISSSNPLISHEKKRKTNQWLETSNHIANIYDGKEKITKELFLKEHYLEQRDLTYELFLDIILSKDSLIKKSLDKIHNIKTAIELQENVESLLYFSKAKNAKELFDILFSKDSSDNEVLKNLKEHIHYLKPLESQVKNFLLCIPDNLDKIFTVDLCKMIVFSNAFSDELIQQIGNMSLNDYWKISKEILRIKDFLKPNLKSIFHKEFFIPWRKENEKTYLKSKRIQEKENNLYSRPYIDLLDEYENEQYTKFWQENFSIFVTYFLFENIYDLNLTPYFEFLKSLDKQSLQDDLEDIKNTLKHLDGPSILSFIKTIRSFNELDRELLYNYPKIRKTKMPLEKHLATSFYPINGFGYTKSFAITNSSSPGSIFKLIPAYTALMEKYNYLIKNNLSLKPSNLNPFSMIDDIYWDSKVKKGGSLVVGTTLDNKPYPRIYKKGRLPKSAHANIGKIDLIKALEKSSNPYFAILSTDFIQNPNNLINTAKAFNIGQRTNIEILNETPGNLPEDIIFDKTSLYSFAIGQHSLVVTPIQTAVMLSAIANKGKILTPHLIKSADIQIKRILPMPDEIRSILLEGLDRVVSSNEGNARANIIDKLRKNSKLMEEYKKNFHTFVGKTSTAEFMYNPNINPSSKPKKYKNIWFGAISFEKRKNSENKKQIWENPELVVVVQLNYGSSGKNAAPIAFQIIQKYRELKEKKSN